jgi:enoyl-CoA hydratase
MARVQVAWDGDTAVATFSRPPVNAFDLQLMDELRSHLEELEASVPRGGLVLTGDGDTFSAGVDFKQAPRYSAEERARMVTGLNAAVAALYALPTATVAAVNGHAIGGGLVMALACDARLAADRSCKLGLTEVTAGLPYPVCPMEVVRAEVEPAYRRHLVMSGDLIEPHTAHARGLIDELVAPGDLLSRSIELARKRAEAVSYAVVKDQLKRDTVARMRAVVASGRDPLLDSAS